MKLLKLKTLHDDKENDLHIDIEQEPIRYYYSYLNKKGSQIAFAHAILHVKETPAQIETKIEELNKETQK